MSERKYEARIPVATLKNGWTVSIVHTKHDFKLARNEGTPDSDERIYNCTSLSAWEPRFTERSHIVLLLADENDTPRANINCGNAEFLVRSFADRVDTDTMYYSSFPEHIVGKRLPRMFWKGSWYPLEFLQPRVAHPTAAKTFKAWYNSLPVPEWAVEIQGYNNLYSASQQMWEKLNASKPVRDRLGRFTSRKKVAA